MKKAGNGKYAYVKKANKYLSYMYSDQVEIGEEFDMLLDAYEGWDTRCYELMKTLSKCKKRLNWRV